MQLGPSPFDDAVDRDDGEDGEDGAETPTPPEPVRRRFWAIVVLLNLGFFAVSLGLMLAGFRRQFGEGALLVGGGLLVLYSAYRRYESRHEVFESVD